MSGYVEPLRTVPPTAEAFWLLYFEDTEVPPMVFYGHSAESGARATYREMLSAWSCYLLVDHRVMERDARALWQAYTELDYRMDATLIEMQMAGLL